MPMCDMEKAHFVILPVAYERTTSYRKGTARGPAKFLEASHQLEFYDEELAGETAKLIAIATAPIFKPSAKEADHKFLKRVSSAVAELVRRKKFVATIGGEHTLTYAPILAYAQVYADLSILYVDAHADLRNEYEGTPWSHACALRRSLEACRLFGGQGRTSMVGIRSMDIEEARYIGDNQNLALFGMAQSYRLCDLADSIIERLGEHVYVSIDLDGLDPAVIPGVGTPQPGGLGWYDLLYLLKKLFERRRVVGVDLMELAPIAGQVISEFAAAKLLYRIIGYSWKNQ